MNLGRTPILTILIIPIHEHGIAIYLFICCFLTRKLSKIKQFLLEFRNYPHLDLVRNFLVVYLSISF